MPTAGAGAAFIESGHAGGGTGAPSPGPVYHITPFPALPMQDRPSHRGKSRPCSPKKLHGPREQPWPTREIEASASFGGICGRASALRRCELVKWRGGW